jgi:DNA-binding XRE family transcriptional regulator
LFRWQYCNVSFAPIPAELGRFPYKCGGNFYLSLLCYLKKAENKKKRKKRWNRMGLHEMGKRLAELRKRGGFSQEQLGRLVGVSRQTVSKWELGDSLR